MWMQRQDTRRPNWRSGAATIREGRETGNCQLRTQAISISTLSALAHGTSESHLPKGFS
jgi:hypothetical protein